MPGALSERKCFNTRTFIRGEYFLFVVVLESENLGFRQSGVALTISSLGKCTTKAAYAVINLILSALNLTLKSLDSLG